MNSEIELPPGFRFHPTDEELVKYWGSVVWILHMSLQMHWLNTHTQESGQYWGTNSRARATHSRSIGWEPRYTKEDMIASIKPEVEYYWKERQ